MFSPNTKAAETVKLQGAIGCWITSSAPPITKTMATEKPKFKNGEEPIDGTNNNWYPTKDQKHENGELIEGRFGTNKIRIGGWGDHYEGYLRWFGREPEFTAKKVVLRFTAKKEGAKGTMPEKIEIRKITGLWKAERLHYSLKPSSEHIKTQALKEGVNEVDITEVVRGWVSDQKTNLGLCFLATQNGNHYARLGEFELLVE